MFLRRFHCSVRCPDSTKKKRNTNAHPAIAIDRSNEPPANLAHTHSSPKFRSRVCVILSIPCRFHPFSRSFITCSFPVCLTGATLRACTGCDQDQAAVVAVAVVDRLLRLARPKLGPPKKVLVDFSVPAGCIATKRTERMQFSSIDAMVMMHSISILAPWPSH